MTTFHHTHSCTQFSSKRPNIPPNLSHIGSLYSKSYCNFFFHTSFFFFFFYFFFLLHNHHFILSCFFWTQEYKLFFHHHYFPSHIVFTFTHTFNSYTNPHYNEMSSIISRLRQFMVFRVKRVKSNVGFKRKLSWFFIIRVKEGANGNDITGRLQKAQTHLKDCPNHFFKIV